MCTRQILPRKKKPNKNTWVFHYHQINENFLGRIWRRDLGKMDNKMMIKCVCVFFRFLKAEFLSFSMAPWPLAVGHGGCTF